MVNHHISVVGTLTLRRYQWDDVIRIAAMVEGVENGRGLGKSKHREPVNEYPLFGPRYASFRLERICKIVVVLLYGVAAYVGVFEWSLMGGMIRMHYMSWKAGALQWRGTVPTRVPGRAIDAVSRSEVPYQRSLLEDSSVVWRISTSLLLIP